MEMSKAVTRVRLPARRNLLEVIRGKNQFWMLPGLISLLMFKFSYAFFNDRFSNPPGLVRAGIPR